MDREAMVHFIGGAAGGTAGTAITCPLEVVKTRLQSSRFANSSSGGPSTSKDGTAKNTTNSMSRSNFSRQHFGRISFPVMPNLPSGSPKLLWPAPFSQMNRFRLLSAAPSMEFPPEKKNILRFFRQIISEEGFGALYKGLGPNLVGVAPSKAVYFYTYSTCKRFWNDVEALVPNSAMVHMISAASAGFVAATAVNPIWLVKTRLQLHKGPLTISQCIKRVYANEGIKGFYRGVTASYVGISETVIQFVIYEHLRSWLLDSRRPNDDSGNNDTSRNNMDFIRFMVAGGSAKFFACVAAYPHEVVRTRLREEHSKAHGFFSTFCTVYRHEGFRALYRGLVVQLLRTVPNTAITMGVYELVVHILHRI